MKVKCLFCDEEHEYACDRDCMTCQELLQIHYCRTRRVACYAKAGMASQRSFRKQQRLLREQRTSANNVDGHHVRAGSDSGTVDGSVANLPSRPYMPRELSDMVQREESQGTPRDSAAGLPAVTIDHEKSSPAIADTQ